MQKFIYYFLILLSAFNLYCLGGIQVYPKNVFLSNTIKSSNLTVTNDGDNKIEISVRLTYSILTTNEDGSVKIINDSIATDLNSCAMWIKTYPERFILDSKESQKIRIIANPTPGLNEGEYWARIILRVIPVRKLSDTNSVKKRTGIFFNQEVGFPIYYRNGKVNTGLNGFDFKVFSIDKEWFYSLKLERFGNAAFNGTQTLKIKNDGGVVVKTFPSVLVVFDTYFLKERINISDLPPGEYEFELTINSTRKDVDNKYLLSITPLRFTTKVFFNK